MQTLLLAANMLALAVLACVIYRMIFAARRRAEEGRTPVSDQQISVSLATGPETADKAPPPVSADGYEESPEPIVAPMVFVTVSPDPVQPAIEEDLPYADPVDGMPFEPGESVVPCACGLAYREDSVKWLSDYCAGCCIHCGARVDLPKLPS